MENKKYLDKVVNHMVKYTKIPSMLLNPLFVPIDRHIPIFTDDPVNDINTTHYLLPMYSYLKTQFGLIDDEVKYVFKQYIDVIIDMYNIRN